MQEELVRTVMNWTEEVFSGQGGQVQAERAFAPLMAKYPDAAAIGVDDIRHFATLVSEHTSSIIPEPDIPRIPCSMARMCHP